ncbi:MAG: glycosyltransferase [Pseudotabrizicola sp.]|uniref:glycosyltransferase n=1 Tax=Pseudotabrizicola sp. TaxID=2939647 RepID=UPI002728083A|nr:glycosyltransferase [Pseudotabrizicola sp.]MDO8884250.1 glycosyltransferase [Pseudotabrizicola sp.]MDP2079665.1 glycosyltransferase [Pseudotabrizicola sp.]MDZ7574572.1 glycosyltransferase [Pseudotabrizicola sp.]
MNERSSLKIALVSAFPPGMLSLNEYGLHLARELAAHPQVAEVVILADKLPLALDELDLGPKLRVERVWRFNSLATLPALLAALRKEKPDGVIFNLQTATFGDREATAALGLLSPMVSRLIGCPSGVIAHNIIAGIDLDTTILKGQRLRQGIVRGGGRIVTAAMCRASYLTTTLASYRDLLVAAQPKRDISLVPHGTFDSTPRPWLALASRPKRIVTMGKFGTYKRLETLIAAFQQLRLDPRHQDLELVIGGTDHPNMAGYMAGVAATHSAQPGLIFRGYVAEDDIATFFESARVSVFDYDSTTGSSGVLHQTASYGAVPVFPHIGDFVDLCRDEGLNGYNYEPGDAAGMASAIDLALSSPEAEHLARANRDAAMGMPLAQVAAFHVEKIARLSAGKMRC